MVREADLNPHELSPHALKRACLPIPALSHYLLLWLHHVYYYISQAFQCQRAPYHIVERPEFRSGHFFEQKEQVQPAFTNLLVPKVGFEPTRAAAHGALNTACLPVPPLRLFGLIGIITYLNLKRKSCTSVEILVSSFICQHPFHK